MRNRERMKPLLLRESGDGRLLQIIEVADMVLPPIDADGCAPLAASRQPADATHPRARVASGSVHVLIVLGHGRRADIQKPVVGSIKVPVVKELVRPAPHDLAHISLLR